MALAVPEPVPPLIRDALAAEREAGREEGRALAGKLTAERAVSRITTARPSRPAPRPRPSKPRDRLAAALAEGRADVLQVAGILRVGPADVQAIAAGRVTLAPASWRRLAKELEPCR